MSNLWKASTSGHLTVLSPMKQQRERPSFSGHSDFLIVTGGAFKDETLSSAE